MDKLRNFKNNWVKNPSKVLEAINKKKDITKLLKQPLFHWSDVNIKEFKNGLSKNGWLGQWIYFTPNKKYAKTHWKNLIEVSINLKNPFIVKGNSPSDVFTEARAMYPKIVDFNISEVLKENWYDWIYYKHWEDEIWEVVSVFDEKNIKTKI